MNSSNHKTDRPSSPDILLKGEGHYIPDLAIMRFSGPDAYEFLQGYLTNDTAKFRPDKLTSWSICNIKGRVIANGWALGKTDTELYLILHKTLTKTLNTFLTPYLNFSKTKCSVIDDEIRVFGSENPVSSQTLELTKSYFLYLQESFNGSNGEMDSVRQSAEWKDYLIDEDQALIQEITSEQFLPQMLGLTDRGAVDFDKGCYLGQEIIARAQYRGAVKRKLKRLNWFGVKPDEGSELLDQNLKPVGTIINVSSGQKSGTCLSVISADASYPIETQRTSFSI